MTSARTVSSTVRILLLYGKNSMTHGRKICCGYCTQSRFSSWCSKLNRRHAFPVKLRCFSNSQLLNDKNSGKDCDTLDELTDLSYNHIADETIHSLTEFLDELAESGFTHPDFDVSYNNGVLTVNMGDEVGTYVINKQSPNKQIWLSSPSSGPKRYDFINGMWIYKHDGVSLHELLTKEFSAVLDTRVDFSTCLFSVPSKGQ